MQAIRLHGAKDLRLDDIPKTPPPGEGQVRLKISSVGVCGSDLHTYKDGRIGDTVVSSPLTLGHEFSGVVTEVGKNASDAHGNPMREGQLVAVDPAVPCWHCEFARQAILTCVQIITFMVFTRMMGLCKKR